MRTLRELVLPRSSCATRKPYASEPELAAVGMIEHATDGTFDVLHFTPRAQQIASNEKDREFSDRRNHERGVAARIHSPMLSHQA